MSVVGARPFKLSQSGASGVRVALIAVLVTAWTVLGGLAPRTSQAALRKDKTPPKKTSSHHTTKTAKQQPKKKAHRKSNLHAKRHQAPAAKQVAQKGAATQKWAKAKHPPRRKAMQHASRARQHGALRVARRPVDPDKLVIPQGDGSPVLSVAARLIGRPYRYGAASGAFDCSGFVRTVFAKVGVDLPHSAREQFTMGDRVSRDDLEPGDLVFFHTYRRGATHVGIYVGDDRFVHAATRAGQVQVDSLEESYYARHYLGARRIEI